MLSITKRDDASSSISSDIGDSGMYWFSKMLRKFLDDLSVAEIQKERYTGTRCS